MKKLDMPLRVSCPLDEHRADVLFTCFLKKAKKN